MVCLPGLHISLGIFQRLYALLEEECHELDLQIASHKDTVLPGSTSATFEKFCLAHRRVRQLKGELFGMMGEQGSESIHARFNSIRAAYRYMPNPVDRLKNIMTEHYLQIAPSNTQLQPPTPKRKKVEE